MMGLQATANKRKLEYDSKCQQTPLPAKLVRLDDGVHEASLGAELEDWRRASSLLGPAECGPAHEDDDEDDEDDEDDDEDEPKGKYLPAGSRYQDVGCYYSEEQSAYGAPYSPRAPPPPQQHHYAARQYWGGTEYYGQDSQQTIRCDENGKSYLDLGSSSAGARYGAVSNKCCDGSRTSWCNRGPGATCYRQRRLTVLNISMCKLGRYRQFPDPSLHRSVLICNTLRYIEREMEQEGFFFNNGAVQAPPPPPPAPTPHPAVEPDPSYHPQFPEVPAPAMSYPLTPYRTVNSCPEIVPQYEQNLRDLSSSGRATPFPGAGHSNYDTDSGVGDDESGRGINWGSVLSLSSQSDLDPLNNNELYPSSPSHSSSSSFGLAPGDSDGSLGLLGDVELGHEFDDFLPSWKLTPLSADDILKSVPSSEFSGRQGEGELDSIMHVLVGT